MKNFQTKMITKLLLCASCILVCSMAKDITPMDLEEKKLQGQSEIKKYLEDAQTALTNIEARMEDDRLYINTSFMKFNNEASDNMKVTHEKLDNMALSVVWEDIDKNKNVNTFQCLMKTSKEIYQMTSTVHENFKKCSKEAFDKQTKQLESFTEQLLLLNMSLEGLFKGPHDSINDCQNEDCVSKQVKKAETRNKNLSNLLNTYNERASEGRSQFNNGQTDCLRRDKQGFEETLKNSSNRLRNC